MPSVSPLVIRAIARAFASIAALLTLALPVGRVGAQSSPIVVTGVVGTSIDGPVRHGMLGGTVFFTVRNISSETQTGYVARWDCGGFVNMDYFDATGEWQPAEDPACPAADGAAMALSLAPGESATVPAGIRLVADPGLEISQVTVMVTSGANSVPLSAGSAQVTWDAWHQTLTATLISPTYTPSVTPKTSVTVGAATYQWQYFYVMNWGNVTAGYNLSAICGGSATNCSVVSGSALTVPPGTDKVVPVIYLSGAAGTTGTVRLVATAPARPSGWVEADTGIVTTSTVDVLAPRIELDPSGTRVDGDDPTTLTVTAHTLAMTVDVIDDDGIVGVPTLIINGATVAPDAVVQTSLGYSAKRATYTLPIPGGYSAAEISVSDGVHLTQLTQRFRYDEAPEHVANVAPVHAAPIFARGATGTDGFVVSNPGWQAAQYSITLFCLGESGVCTATTPTPTITVPSHGSVVVTVGFPLGTTVGATTRVTLTATYNGALTSRASGAMLTASIGALLSPTVTLSPASGTNVSSSTIALVAVWCDPDDALGQHTVVWQGSTLPDVYVPETRAGCATAGRSTWPTLAIAPGAQTAVATAVDVVGHSATATTTVTFTPPVTAYQPAVSPKTGLRSVAPGVAESETFTVRNAGAYAASYTLSGSCGSLSSCSVSPGVVTLAPGATASATVRFVAPTVPSEVDAVRLIARYTSASGAIAADTGTTSVQYIEATFTPSIVASTPVTVAALGISTQTFSVYNAGNTTGTFTFALTCTGALSGCALSSTAPAAIDPGQRVVRLVTFTTGLPGTTGTATLRVTPPARFSQLVEVKTFDMAVTAMDLVAPGIDIAPAGDRDPATGQIAPLTISSRSTVVTVNVHDTDGLVGAPTLTLAGATVAPTSVVATSEGFASSKRALYTLSFQPGLNVVAATVSDGVHTATAEQRYVYDDAAEHAAVIVAVHPAPQVPVNRTVVDTFTVTNRGWHSATYSIVATCSFVVNSPPCVASSAMGSVTLAAGASVLVPVTYATAKAVGQTTTVGLNAIYVGAVSTKAALGQLVATVGAVLPPQVTITPINGTTVSTSTITLVVSWCDADDAFAQRTVTWQGQVLPDTWQWTTVAGCAFAGQSTWTNLPIDPWAQTAVVTATDNGGHAVTQTATITRVVPIAQFTPAVTPKTGSHRVALHAAAADTFVVANTGPYAAAYGVTPSCVGLANCVATPSVVTVQPGTSAPVVVTYMSSGAAAERDTVKLIARFTASTGASIADTGRKVVVVPASEVAPTLTTSATPVVLPPGFRSAVVYTLANPSSEAVTYAIHTTSTGGFGFPDWFTPPTTIAVDAGQSTFVTLSFAAPVTDGISGSMTLSADYVATSGVTLSASATAVLRTQSPQPRVAVTPKTSSYVADAGLSATQVGFTVTNTGNVGVTGRATMTCPSASTSAVAHCDPNAASAPISTVQAPADLVLIPGQTKTFLIDIQLRGGVPGRVQLAFDGAADGLAVHDTGTITVRRAGDFMALTVTPKAETLTVRPQGSVIRRFTITNAGTFAAAFDYVAACAGNSVTCTALSGSTGVLNPNATFPVTVTAMSQSAGQAGIMSVRATAAIDGTVADTGRVSVVTGASVALTVDVVHANPGTNVDRGLCLTIAAGAEAAYECGDLRLAHSLPSITTMNTSRAPTLVYNSRHHSGIVLVAADVTIGGGNSPTSLTAHVIIDGKPSVDTTFEWRPEWSGGPPRRIVVPVRVRDLGLHTGAYHYTFAVDAGSGTSTIQENTEGVLAVINRAASPFGPGWWLDGLEQLVPYSSTQKLWVGGDGTTRLYTRSSTDTTVWTVQPAVDRPDTLRQASPTRFRRLLRNGGYVSFDVLGQHDTTVNALGHRTAFTYDPNGTFRLASIVLPGRSGSVTSRTYTFQYAGAYLNEVIAPAGSGGAPRLTWVHVASAPNNEPVVFSITDPDNTVVGFGFDDHARLVSRVDRRSKTTTFAYDAAGGLDSSQIMSDVSQAIVHAFCPAETASLTACAPGPIVVDSVRTLFVGPRQIGDSTRFFLTPFGAPTRIVNALGEETRIARDSTRWPFLATSLTQPNGHQVITAYDSSRGLPLTTTDVNPLGTGANAITNYTWDAKWAKLTAVTTAMGVEDHFAYDSATGLRLWQQHGPSATRRVTFHYDPVTHQLTSSAAPLVADDSIEYDLVLGNVSAVRSRAGHWSTYARDALGRDSASTSAIDPNDVLRDGVASARLVALTLYDIAGRPRESFTTGSTDIEAQTVHVVNGYDAEGNLERVERSMMPDPNTIGTMITRSYFDGANRKIADEAPDHAIDSTGYDPAGNVVRHRARTGDVVTMTYDKLNRLVQRVTPEVHVNPENAPGGTFLLFPRYPVGGTSGVTIPADTATFEYDNLGQMRAANNADARVSRTFYRNGALQSETQAIRSYTGSDFSQHGFVFGYTYDLDGRRLAMDRGNSVSYGYVPLTGELSSVTAAGNSFTFAYDAAGRLAAQYTGGIRDTNEYDPGDRLIRRTETGAYVGPLSFFTPGVLHADTLSYDAREKIIGVHTTLDTSVTRYTGLGAVMASASRDLLTHELTQTSFSPDALGNLVQSSDVAVDIYAYTHDGTGRLLTHTRNGSTADASRYDSAGNQTHYGRMQFVGSAPAASFSRSYYGADGKLRVVDRAVDTLTAFSSLGPDQLMAFEEYRYDALGRRVLKRSRRNGCEGRCQSAIERYGWDGNDLVHEIRYPGRDGLSAAALEIDTGFVFTVDRRPPFVDDQPEVYDTVYSPHYGTATYTYAGAIDRPVMVERKWFGQDTTRVGDVTAVLHYNYRGIVDEGTDFAGHRLAAGGLKVDWPGSDVRLFGNRLSHGVPRSWMGGVIDGMRDATGFQYRRNRYYDPESGRFTQEDPIGLAGGLNLYGFAGGDPVNFSDPLGLYPMECPPACPLPGAAGAVAGAAGGAAALLGATSNADVVAAGISTAVDAFADRFQIKFVTYTRAGPGGQVYSGRTSGVGDPQSIVNARARTHPDRLDDFGPPLVDVWATGAQGYAAIRGREQQLIDANGRAQSEGGTSANIRRGVNKTASPLFEAIATLTFGAPPPPRP